MSDLPELSYCRPRRLEEALRALARPGACAYAGGTDLLVALGAGQAWTRGIRELVDIKDLDTAKGITKVGASLRVGALTTAAELAASALVRREARALAEAAGATSAPALRRRGTVGGNIVTPHPAGDVVTALLALDATVELVEGKTIRDRPLAALLTPSSRRRAKARLVLAVRFLRCPHSAFEKQGSRAEFSRSIIAVGVTAGRSGVRIALGGIAERPFFAARASAAAAPGRGLRVELGGDCHAQEGGHAPTPYQLRLTDALVERALARARQA